MLAELKQLLRSSNKTVALTGAGVSTLSGIADFRGSGGLSEATYEGFAIETVLSRPFFETNPELFYRWAGQFVYRLEEYEPSIVHTTLACLEEMGYLSSIYTQNIDRLHHKGGSQNVYELHGSAAWHTCPSCRKKVPYEEVAPVVRKEQIPRCNECQEVLSPEIILYGDPLNQELLQQAFSEMSETDLVLVLGSSLLVQPVATLPEIALQQGATLVIVNATSTPLDRYARLKFSDLGSLFSDLDAWLATLK